MVHYIKDFPSLCPPLNNKRNILYSHEPGQKLIRFKAPCRNIINICINQWRIQDFPQGDAPTPKIAIIFQIFAENCMKMKEFGPPGGSTRPWCPPLDPPMLFIYIFFLNCAGKSVILTIIFLVNNNAVADLKGRRPTAQIISISCSLAFFGKFVTENAGRIQDSP